jgi:uncharacterized membrane protein
VIVHVSPESSWLVRGAADAVLYLHITGGTVGIASGTVALLSEKGGRLHRAAGNMFFAAMLVMAAVGAMVAPLLPQRLSSVTGVLTFYLVATAWVTVRRKAGTVGRFETGAMLAAAVTAAAGFVLAWQGSKLPHGMIDDQPYQSGYVFGGIAALAAMFDLKVILRGGISGAQRIARHLWRMCFALFIGATSLFAGQPQVFPKLLRGSAVLTFGPELAVLIAMVFWLLRVRFSDSFRDAAANSPSPVSPG